MRLSWKARRRLALLVLVIGLPAYIVVAITIVSSLDRPSVLVEFLIYVGLGILWALPFRAIFRGVSRPDPDAAPTRDDPD